MSQELPGVIHGKTIELRDDPGLGAGQKVRVVIEPELIAGARERALRAAAGALALLPDEAFEDLEAIVRDRRLWSDRDFTE